MEDKSPRLSFYFLVKSPLGQSHHMLEMQESKQLSEGEGWEWRPHLTATHLHTKGWHESLQTPYPQRLANSQQSLPSLSTTCQPWAPAAEAKFGVRTQPPFHSSCMAHPQGRAVFQEDLWPTIFNVPWNGNEFLQMTESEVTWHLVMALSNARATVPVCLIALISSRCRACHYTDNARGLDSVRHLKTSMKIHHFQKSIIFL